MEIELIKSKIYEIRGEKVMRFPDDFMFELTKDEYEFLRCNFGALETDANTDNRGKHCTKAVDKFVVGKSGDEK
jgi:predicted adenine nucleotide alpha hydrolase (AANH) superfamily ATPase